jgi:hypothetical protein
VERDDGGATVGPHVGQHPSVDVLQPGGDRGPSIYV